MTGYSAIGAWVSSVLSVPLSHTFHKKIHVRCIGTYRPPKLVHTRAGRFFVKCAADAADKTDETSPFENGHCTRARVCQRHICLMC